MSGALFNHAIEKLRAMPSAPVAPCKICDGEAYPFDILDFNKSCMKGQYVFGLSGVPVIYRMCKQCQFIFTDFGDNFSSKEWAQNVYNDDYFKIDPDYVHARPRHNAREIITLLAGKKGETVGLDYGGGNGKTAALLRENGWTFDSYDPYGAIEMSPERLGRYNFCSAIEVFEHTPNPVASLDTMLKIATAGRLLILIGTGTHDGNVSEETRLSWWYAAPRNGHVSLYSRKSLQVLAERFGLTYSCGRNGASHLLARGVGGKETGMLLRRGKLLRRLRSTFGLWKGELAEV